MYDLEEYRSHYNWRFGGSDITFNDFLRSERRKLHQGKFKNIDFFIRYIKSPEDWKGTYYDYQYNNYGEISIKAKVFDSKNSIFTPCSYKVKGIKLLKNNINLQEKELHLITEVNSYRGRYCEQAIQGEEVLIEGKLERVDYKGDNYFRILLTDQINDKMIVLS